MSSTASLKKYLIDEKKSPDECCRKIVLDLKKKYRVLFTIGDQLKPMEGKPAVLEVQDDVKVKPTHICTPRKTPGVR